jgi:hypothetical protein
LVHLVWQIRRLDISDPGGAIKLRGEARFTGNLIPYGTDNGRWNLDFADKTHAHVVGCASGYGYCGSNTDSYVLATADFSPSMATGSASYEIPISVPPASAGFGLPRSVWPDPNRRQGRRSQPTGIRGRAVPSGRQATARGSSVAVRPARGTSRVSWAQCNPFVVHARRAMTYATSETCLCPREVAGRVS